MISKLTERIEKTLQMNFKDFAGKAETKEEKIAVIIGFLAMLELVRQGLLHAIQEGSFEDIIIKKNNE
jgi:chromatin segregation and condensation protein Rec8/ScpA/Scc1 (kleisin family)